jgi:type IV pilus assembly protein PilV
VCKCPTLRRARGAFLLEALVAAAVFAIGVLGAAAFHAESMRRIDDARNRTAAAHLTLGLMARMWTEDPATLDARYAGGGDGYAAFARLARQLPGGERDENAPTVRVDAGPSASSRTVTATVRWQSAGNATAHRFAASAVIGSN